MAQKDTQQSKQDPGEAGGQEVAAQEEKAREPEMKDPLCGLLNREAVVRYIEKRLFAMAEADSCALFLIDLDDFSRVNATLGRQAGDRVLRQAAQILSGLFRANDVVGRLGGDEFIALMYGVSTREIIERKAEELCARIRSIRMAHPRYSGVSVSIGVAIAPEHGDSFEELYAKADVALYHAKQGGRDRFVIYGGE